MRNPRIKTIQAQHVVLGVLRSGYSVATDKGDYRRPVRSDEWIVTSDSKTYAEAAAELWGGDVEPWTPQRSKIAQWRVITGTDTLDILLPPGDPLTTTYELWDRGGVKLRCDGITETRTRRPCVCTATFGKNWHQRGGLGEICKPTSRLKLLLPDMPNLGVWRYETHSWYAAAELAGQVDAVLEGTGGKGLVPAHLKITQREVLRDGRTKQFPVVALVPQLPRLRHVLTGPLTSAAALDPASLERPAIEPPTDYAADGLAARTIQKVHDIWFEALKADRLTTELKSLLIARATAINAALPDDGDDDTRDDQEPIDVEIVDDTQPTWPKVPHIPGSTP